MSTLRNINFKKAIVLQTIALVANTSWSIYNFRRGLIRKLMELNYRVLVIAPQDNFSAALLAEGVEYVPLDMNNYGTNPLEEWRTYRSLRKIYRRYRPNLIFHYTIKPNIYGSLAASSCGIPSIAVITGLGHTFTHDNKLNRLVVFLYKMALRKSREVWFLNESDREVFMEKRIADNSVSIVLPGEGVDTEHFKASSKVPDHPLTFLYAGRMLKDKGVLDFVAAARIVKAKHPEVHFNMIGFIDQKNPNTVSFSDLLNWQKEKIVSYFGETTDIRPFVDSSDCVVLPSYYGEGLSRVLLEAASMGKPIITTRNVGCEQLVMENENGFLCNIRDPQDLAAKMMQLHALSTEERVKMGKVSRSLVEAHYDEKKILDIYLNKIQNIIGK
ncbi:MAG TPA: glycosyltransferase family 4 protein [Parasegetibacter sp.]